MNTGDALAERTVRKVSYRLLPFLFILYVIAFLDRVNFGYAALEMNSALGLSAEVFLTETAAAVGITTINSVGNLGGFISPSLVGYLTQSAGSTNVGLVAIGGCLVLCGLLTFTVRVRESAHKYRFTS